VWWVTFAGPVWPSTVVMLNVLREHRTQMPLIEDQHSIGEFGPEGAHEPFGKAVRTRAARRNPHHGDPGVGQDSIQRRGELSGAVLDEVPELGDAVAEIHRQVADLLGGPSAVGVRGRTQQVHGPVGHLQHEEYGDPLEGERAVHVEEVARQHGRGLGAQD
jgi:hypothetical protein